GRRALWPGARPGGGAVPQPAAVPRRAGRRRAEGLRRAAGLGRAVLRRAVALPGAPAPRPGPPRRLDDHADRDGDRQREQQPHPRPVLESLTAQPAEEEAATGGDQRRAGGRQDEAAPRIPDQPARERDGGTPAGDETAADDDAGAEAVQGPLGPGAPAGTALPGEHAPFGGRPEAPAEQGGGVGPR